LAPEHYSAPLPLDVCRLYVEINLSDSTLYLQFKNPI
jgi:hypothetical protein